MSGKSVKLQYIGKTTPSCKYAEIVVDNELYSKKLKNSGLGFDDKGNFTQSYQSQLSKARKLNLIILNHKSNKYHTLTANMDFLRMIQLLYLQGKSLMVQNRVNSAIFKNPNIKNLIKRNLIRI